MLWLAAAALAAPSIDEPVRSGAVAPNDAALVVAIEDYAFLPDVPHARRDGQAVADLLTYTRGIPAEHVVRLDGGSLEQLRVGLDRAKANVGPGGRLWVYFAGHGAADPATGALLLVGDDAKADPSVFAARSLPVDALLAAIPDGSVVLLDTCWAGAARSGDALIPGARFAVPAYASAGGKTVWTASSPTQIAGSYAPARHGAFTYFAVGALRGWADGETTGAPDGQVDLAEASAYIGRAMAAAGIASQTPTLDGPTVAVTSGQLERGPELASLAARPEPAAVIGLLMAAPMQSDWAPPIREVRRGLYADANDRTVPYADLVASLQDDLAGKEALQRFSAAHRPAVVGTGLAVIGGLELALVSWIPFLQYSKAKNGASCSDADAIEYACINEQGSLIAGTVLTGTGAALLTSGIVLNTTSAKKRQRAREALLDTVNARLAR